MRIFISVLILCFISATVFTQPRELLIGKWDYHAIRKVQEAEPMPEPLLKIVVGNNSFFNFSRNHRYVAYENNYYARGEWQLDHNNSTLVLIPESGIRQTFEIVTLSKSTLILLKQGDAYHTLVKNREPFHQVKNHVSPEAGIAQATPEEISRRWVLLELQDSLESEEVNKQMTEFVKGGWYDIRANGVYAKKMITQEKTGRWKLQNENRTIIMIDDDGFGSVWNISFVSPAKLILQRPGTSIRHIFTALH